jgi:hypothetical protein
MATILEIVNRACVRLSMRPPRTLFGRYNEGDTTDLKMREALTQTARFLAKDYNWNALLAEHTFTTIAGEAQALGTPLDLLRYVQDTLVDGAQFWWYDGPVEPAEWARRKLNASWAYMYDAGTLKITPAPNAGRVMSLWYVRNAICTRTVPAPGAGWVDLEGNGTPPAVGPATIDIKDSKFTTDNDVPLWDEELMVLGVVYHFRKMERNDYAQDEYDFQKCMADCIKMDGSRRVLNLGGPRPRNASDMVRSMKNAALVITPY